MYTCRTDVDVTKGRLQILRYFQGIYCMYCNTTNYIKTMVCGVAVLYVKTIVSGVAINSL